MIVQSSLILRRWEFLSSRQYLPPSHVCSQWRWCARTLPLTSDDLYGCPCQNLSRAKISDPMLGVMLSAFWMKEYCCVVWYSFLNQCSIHVQDYGDLGGFFLEFFLGWVKNFGYHRISMKIYPDPSRKPVSRWRPEPSRRGGRAIAGLALLEIPYIQCLVKFEGVANVGKSWSNRDSLQYLSFGATSSSHQDQLIRPA